MAGGLGRTHDKEKNKEAEYGEDGTEGDKKKRKVNIGWLCTLFACFLITL